ncbi:MAG: flagellar biosynthetic protein FliO [endosymbiont of Escarpia spicata]|uniref:Flagellar protein n=1 Tax=endosymbiont of Escarpia spicata TaxID=2200908 RepID=A0A370DQD8_9GAMM|nr:MAG: flagellar biosynthetic protein FliO [endosymbiont of Escarpia spicata]
MRILALIPAICSGSLLAAETAVRKVEVSPLSTQNLLRTAGGLLFVIFLIFAAGWLFKRFGQLQMSGKGMVTVLGGTSVGPRERVVVVKVDDIRLLLGVAPGRVQTLHVLDQNEDEVTFDEQLAEAKEELPS